ncbi:MAG TPA: hypothetical protein VJK51_03590 [Candidatus Nanoarchaeia archaeon]|nr:hypothetical protein [Candidatus Nanoarchaeia archaeon]
MNMLRRKLSVGALGLASLVGCGEIRESNSKDGDQALSYILTGGRHITPPKQSVVVNNQIDQQPRGNVVKCFVASGYRGDLNRNGIRDEPDFQRVDTEFNRDENVVLVLHDERISSGSMFLFEIYEENKLILSQNLNSIDGGSALILNGLDKYNPGKYEAVWSLSGRRLRGISFRLN